VVETNIALTAVGGRYNPQSTKHLCPGGGMVDALASGASVSKSSEIYISKIFKPAKKSGWFNDFKQQTS